MTDDRSNYEEVWVEAEDGQSMCALINGHTGFLMYRRHPGDSGFTSRNPNYRGPTDAVQEYYLNNGQRDEYPMLWAIPFPPWCRWMAASQ
jgi:hypothetical protein